MPYPKLAVLPVSPMGTNKVFGSEAYCRGIFAPYCTPSQSVLKSAAKFTFWYSSQVFTFPTSMHYPVRRLEVSRKSHEYMRFLTGGRYACDLQSFGVRVRPFHCRVFLRTALW